MRAADAQKTNDWQEGQRSQLDFWQRWSKELPTAPLLRDLAMHAGFIRLLAESSFERNLEDARIVEVGAGLRPVVHFLPGRYRACVDPLMSQYLRLRKDAFTSAVDHFEAAAEGLPFPDRSFDVCITLNSIDVCMDAARALAEFSRVLDRPGYLVISVNTYRPVARALRVAACLAGVCHDRLSYPRIFSERSFRRLVEKEFDVIRCVIERDDYLWEKEGGARGVSARFSRRCDRTTLFAKTRT